MFLTDEYATCMGGPYISGINEMSIMRLRLYLHQWDNHTENFVHPNTGCNTIKIECSGFQQEERLKICFLC